MLLALLGATAFGNAADNNPTARAGKYQFELRLPEGGLYAGESVDVEFRLSDTTQNDPIEGNKGVPNASPKASVTMPEMPGMPVARPTIHAEGVPGDYGIELFFPHGGKYRVSLIATPPGDKPIRASFDLDVRDAQARPKHAAALPYKVQLVGFPSRATAGKPLDLRLAILDSKTGQRVKSFDVAHTKLIHLIVVSKDLGWFVHEHPTPRNDGTFGMKWTFPAGGEYVVFADVAPKGKGSQVLSTNVKVAGPAGRWPKKLIPSARVQRTPEMAVSLRSVENPIPIGKTTDLAFRLKDRKTGKPIVDLQPYLGALGHLMIVHQDGKTFVHSHPSEEAKQTGEVRFAARFPKPGIYKAWVQFQRGGKVSTLAYVFEVKR